MSSKTLSHRARRGLRPQQQVAAEAQGVLKNVIDLIDQARFVPARPEEGGFSVPPRAFNRAVLVAEELSNVDSGDDIWVGPEVFDLGPIHSRVITNQARNPNELAVLWAVDSVGPKQTRGRVRRPMRQMLRVRVANAHRNGRAYTTEAYYGVRPDGLLTDITNVDAINVYGPTAERQLAIRLAAGMAMRMEYSWSVDIGAIGGEFAITVPTTSEGARSLLSLRDVPAGSERRKALRHWVNQHRRVVRRGEADELAVDVRGHLRGVTPFQWEDLTGVVRPSAYDLRRAAQ